MPNGQLFISSLQQDEEVKTEQALCFFGAPSPRSAASLTVREGTRVFGSGVCQALCKIQSPLPHSHTIPSLPGATLRMQHEATWAS